MDWNNYCQQRTELKTKQKVQNFLFQTTFVFMEAVWKRKFNEKVKPTRPDLAIAKEIIWKQ